MCLHDNEVFMFLGPNEIEAKHPLSSDAVLIFLDWFLECNWLVGEMIQGRTVRYVAGKHEHKLLMDLCFVNHAANK